jgi:hypothetical protein
MTGSSDKDIKFWEFDTTSVRDDGEEDMVSFGKHSSR